MPSGCGSRSAWRPWQVEAALKKTPDDLRLRFALGVMTMELGQQARARALFQALTQEHPDLADPHNNLAVLQAAAGDLDGARASLDQALRLQPDHQRAQENLGDVLVRLATRAYEQTPRVRRPPRHRCRTSCSARSPDPRPQPEPLSPRQLWSPLP